MTSLGKLPVITKEKLVAGLRLLFRDIAETADGIILPYDSGEFDGRVSNLVTDDAIKDISQTLDSARLSDKSALIWPARAEFMVSQLGDRPGVLRSDELEVRDTSEGAISYRLGVPSPEFIATLLVLFADNTVDMGSSALWRFRDRLRLRRRGRVSSLSDDAEPPSGEIPALTFLSRLFPVRTLEILSPTKRDDFESLAESFLFHWAYNFDSAMRLSDGFEQLARSNRIQRLRRSNVRTIDVPRQIYEHELTQHYLMGVAASVPLLEYLSFYHVAEHFFRKVFDDDLVEQVRKGITDPSFSVRRSTDIQKIIKVIKKAQDQIKEEGGFGEQRSLQLVLEKFVNLPRLVNDLTAYDANLVRHYAETKVSFADAPAVDLASPNAAAVLNTLARRIYKVRNALVHAKEGALPKYAPFKHDSDLELEVPLMRFIAEQIVIFHGKAIQV